MGASTNVDIPRNTVEVKVPTTYKVNVSKIESIEDVKAVLSKMDLTFTPKTGQDFSEVQHLLDEV